MGRTTDEEIIYERDDYDYEGGEMKRARRPRPPPGPPPPPNAPPNAIQLKCVWEFRPTRAVLLGTIDPGSVLYRLPKSDGVLNIILGFVVLYYEEEVLAQRVLGELMRDNVCAGHQGRYVQGSEARQPDAVADGARGVLCARPRERNRRLCKYCPLQCGPALV